MYKIHQLANLLFILMCVRGQGLEDNCGPCKCNRTDFLNQESVVMMCENITFVQLMHSGWSPDIYYYRSRDEFTEINVTFKNIDDFTPSYFPEWARSITTLKIVNSTTALNFEIQNFAALRKLTLENVRGSINLKFPTFDRYQIMIEELIIINSNFYVEFPTELIEVKTLWMENMGLEKITQFHFYNVIELYLPRNNITNFKVMNATGGSLSVLDLTKNQISIVPANALSGLMKKDNNLKTILLPWNKITYIHPAVFVGYNILKLDLSHNALKSMDSAVILGIALNVNLQFNPWRCNYKIQWITENFIDILNSTYPELVPEIRCETPLELKGKQLITWDNNKDGFFGNPEDVATDMKALGVVDSSQNVGLFKESAEATNKLTDALNRFVDNAENRVNCTSDKSHPLQTEIYRSIEALHWHINNTWETPSTLQALMNHSMEITSGSLLILTQILNILNNTQMQRMSKEASLESANPLVGALRTENLRLNDGGGMSSGMTTIFTLLAILCIVQFSINATLCWKFIFKSSTRNNPSLELLKDDPSV